MRIAITGAQGMLGCDVVSALQDDHQVIPFPPHKDLPLEDYSKVREFMLSEKPEVVVHLAAMRNPDDVEKNPVQGWSSNFQSTYNLVRLLLELDGVMVYGSTDSVFSGHDDEGPYHEFSLCHPLNIYGQTKYASEQIIRERMRKYFILRLPWLFGLGGRPEINPILNAIKKAKAGETTTVGADMWSSACATVDVAWAMRQILATQQWGTYHLASQPPVSRVGTLRAILKEAGLNTDLVEETNYVDARKPARRAHYSVMTSVLLEPTFGFEMPSWKIALKKCIQELKTQGIV